MSKLRCLGPFLFILSFFILLAGCSEPKISESQPEVVESQPSVDKTEPSNGDSQPVFGESQPEINEEIDIINRLGNVKNLEKLDAFIDKSIETQRIIQYTIEGDPIFYMLQHQDNHIEVIYDTTQDEFGTPRVDTYTCDKLKKIEGEHVLEYTLTGCSGEGNEIKILQVPLDVTQMDQFDFVLKYGVHLGNIINTVDGKLVKDLQNGETASTHFQLTPAELQTIYKHMVLANYNEEKQLTTSCNKKPHEAYDLTVYSNNRSFHYAWSECDKSTDGKMMSSLRNKIIEIIKEKDAYKQLPPTQGFYE